VKNNNKGPSLSNHSDILKKQLWRKNSRWTIPLNY